jgi:hypothetical protein
MTRPDWARYQQMAFMEGRLYSSPPAGHRLGKQSDAAR